MTVFWFGQMTNQTLAHMIVPRIAPVVIAQPYGPSKAAPIWPACTSSMAQPATNVPIAAWRNHQSARGTSLDVATFFTPASTSAKKGPCTKLK